MVIPCTDRRAYGVPCRSYERRHRRRGATTQGVGGPLFAIVLSTEALACYLLVSNRAERGAVMILPPRWTRDRARSAWQSHRPAKLVARCAAATGSGGHLWWRVRWRGITCNVPSPTGPRTSDIVGHTPRSPLRWWASRCSVTGRLCGPETSLRWPAAHDHCDAPTSLARARVVWPRRGGRS